MGSDAVTAEQAADEIREKTVAYLRGFGPACSLDALTRPIPGLGKPACPVARSTLYAAAERHEVPWSVFRVGRRLMVSTTAVLRTLDLDGAPPTPAHSCRCSQEEGGAAG